MTRAPEEFLDLLVGEEVSVLSQTPTAFRSLVAAAASGDRRVKRLSLRAVIFAGEKLEVSELQPWTDRLGLGRTSLVNMYGITETTVHTTYHRLTKRDFAPGAGNPVGRPLADLTVHLLDAQGAEVPVGTEGEIHVAGPGVARGYLGRPDLTAERFVPNPFGPAGGRMYRSGDLARRREDGSLEFLGRIDDQVKIRGYRIELGEISAALTAHEDIAQAVVVVREDTPGDKRLVGYLVAAGQFLPDAGDLRAHLARTLPEYMVPAAFVALDTLPLTTNGKLDKRALPAPEEGGQLRSAAGYVAPRTAIEAQVAAVFQSVLGVDKAGVHDSFFDLGGDSIRAVLLVGTLRDAGYELSVRELMERPVLGPLAELLAGRTGAAPAAAPAPVAPYAQISTADRELLPAAVVDAYPLTQNQLGMQIEMLSAPERPDYHLVTSLRLRDARPFDAAAFQWALDALVARHDVLRTSVDLDTYSVPLQLVHGTTELRLKVVDLTGLGEAGATAAIEAYVDERGRTALDPAAAPLLDVTVHLCADGSRQLTAVNSHVILDGWSLGGLLTELLALYDGALAGKLPAHEAPAVRFADTVAAEARALESAEDRAHWQAVVAGHERFALPAGWGETDPDASEEMYLLDVGYADLTEGLERLAAQAQAPLKSVLLAGHLKALSLLTPEPAFLTGLTSHVRPEAAGADRVHGMFLNIQPIGYTDGARTWRELVERTLAAELAGWPHRHFPMPAIQREFGDGSRLVEVYFSYQDFTSVAAGQQDLGARVDADASTGASSNEFGFSVGTAPGRLQLRCAPRAVGRAHGERIAALYRQVLVEMAGGADGDARSGCLPPAETGRIAGWEAAPEGATADRPVYEVFSERAARTPDAVAVAGEGFTLTYAELEARSNQIAHHLLAQGVGTESLVGVLLDRGPDLHAALLGVWKAGAAYIPLDPAFPAARIETMLDDAGATLALTGTGYTDRFAAGVTVVDLAADAAAIAARPTAPAGVPGEPDRLAYAIYTSGSTGRPKGVAVSHRGLANHLGWAVRELVGAGTGGGAVFSSVAFDLVVPNLWAPLLTGRPVVLLPQDLDLSELGERLLAHGPYAFLKLTPGHLEVLSHQVSDEQARDLAGVIVVAGEALQGELASRWAEVLGAGRLINEYGPTEASVGTSVLPLTWPLAAEVVPIGRPLPGMVMRVLDGGMRRVPAGAVGELYVGGTGVARGYIGRAALTAETFLPDPYGPPGARIYRTGDLARWLADGTVEFLGRADDQVKIRGYRVETGEIQAVLLGHPAVRAAFVTGREHAPGDVRLAAYVVLDDAIEAGALARHSTGKLPDYMVPATFTVLDSMPLNANGKVDRKALPDPEAADSEGEFVEPATPTEIALAAIWARVLGVERVGSTDSFFARGGHSILVIQVVAAAREAQLPLSLFMLYQHETLAELAAAVDEAVAAAAPKPAPVPAPASLLPVPAEVLERYRVPGVSVAVIIGGELVAAEAHGLAAGGVPVTPVTTFQVGSLSKHVTAFGALRLVGDGVLALDEDVNTYLRGWRVPDGEVPVTVRQLLGHLAGLTPTPGKGFQPGDAVPTLLDLLHGSGPATTAPVGRDLEPGTVFRKANVHYSVLQQAMTDATGEPFHQLMRTLVLDPLGMRDSSFDQGFPVMPGRVGKVALGHDAEGRQIEGGRRIRPDAAAAGLWSTAPDLAKLALEIRRSALGRPLALLREETAAELLTPHRDTFYGLGTVVDATGADTQFGHGGTPTGYHGVSVTRLTAGSGLVVLTNGDAGEHVVKAIAAAMDTV
ncbi:amino acid adenylation domain-containing protein [Streptomyces mirabilis]|uniref:amino acid adenylation domain-containing protein n=1 Tax=Streptomyces mirabilis TaxID=68239 RepID=UPI0036DA6072